MAQTVKQKSVLRKQPAMRRMLIAMIPPLAGGIYFFGWRSLVMVLFCCAVGFFYEWLFCRWRKEPISEAVFVTGALFALAMPPGVGWHVMAVGMGFAILFSKEMFGGFGKNIFNPAIAGRCFVYICFPIALTGAWYPPAQGTWGAFKQWTTMVSADGTSTMTSATPLSQIKAGRIELAESSDSQAVQAVPMRLSDDEHVKLNKWVLWKTLSIGNLPGSMGATSAALLLIGGVYLFITKTASRTIILTMTICYFVFNEVFYRFGAPVPPGLSAILGGGFFLAACYMATDPVSAPRTEQAKIAYSIIICFCALVIRNFSIFNGGLMFSILIGNMFAPILDILVKEYWPKKKTVTAGGSI